MLLSDDTAVIDHPLAGGFAERRLIEFPIAIEPAEVRRRNRVVSILRRGRRTPRRLPEQFFLWLHVGSLGRVWDAPLEFRTQYADEDDPPLPESVDGDAERGFSQPTSILTCCWAWHIAIPGQVTLLDTCLAPFHRSRYRLALRTATMLAGVIHGAWFSSG